MDAVLQKVRKFADPNTRFYTKKMTSEQTAKIKILEKVTKVDPKQVVNKLAEEAISIVLQLQDKFSTIMTPRQMQAILEAANKKSNITFNNAGQYAEITDLFVQISTLLKALPLQCAFCPDGIVCLIPDELMFLCSDAFLALADQLTILLDCLSANGETVFEDSLEWVQCAYNCR